MAVRNAVRGVSNILKRPFAKALHIGSTPYNYGKLQWHLWDVPPAVVDDAPLADTSIAYFPIHTLTIYIPQLADWQWHAWGPLVVRRPDGQYLRIADVLGAIYEYLHAPHTVADVAELRIARRTPDVGGKWARDAGESWSWEAEVMQFMLNRVESAGPEKVGVVPRRVDMLAGKLWFDKLVQALGHGQHAEMLMSFEDGWNGGMTPSCKKSFPPP
ncbi:hypothetical protein EV121DRAFT_272620 [Schizophyllum commune]